MSKLGFIEVAA